MRAEHREIATERNSEERPEVRCALSVELDFELSDVEHEVQEPFGVDLLGRRKTEICLVFVARHERFRGSFCCRFVDGGLNRE